MPLFDGAHALNALRYEISGSDYEPISTKKDLEEFLKKRNYKTVFNEYRSSWIAYLNAPTHWRIGQAFMNCLPNELDVKLTGTQLDPFYKDDLPSVLKALDYLILSE